MNIFTNKKTVQKIIIAILIVLSFNFLAPTYSQADFGGVLLGPIIDLFAGVGDAVMSAMQFFMYDGQINTAGAIGETLDTVATIVNPFASFLLMRGHDDFKGKLQEYGMNADGEEADVKIDSDKFDKGLLSWVPFGLGDKDYGIPVIKYTPEAIFGNRVPALDVNFINPKEWNDKDKDKHSITQALHSTIANWYIALRNLAIVALLSVLLYVGIRMVISSTASDKAKYKQMIMDWIVALCILFFLHYIMSFILTVTSIITEGIDNGSTIVVQVNEGGSEDFRYKTDFTGLCRLQVQYSDLGSRIIYLIFYIALVIYTVMFTWTYVKRAITMAFLTLMAPLVAITYPIDKIGDGKAQAFGIWLKEFIFNALLQPFHLIIYTIFLGSSMEIAVKNPIYAILFLAFIIPSEKLLRKMFGFEKASTAGAMGAAASMLGGAAVMKTAGNLIGKVGGGKAAGGKTGVRTKNSAITDSNAPSKLKDMASTLGGAKAQGTRITQEDNTEPTNENIPDSDSGTNPITGSGFTQTQSGLWVPSTTTVKPQNSSTQPQLSQQSQDRNKRFRDNFAFRKDENGKYDDSRGLGQWFSDSAQTVGTAAKGTAHRISQKLNDKYGNTKLGRGVKTLNNTARTIGGKVVGTGRAIKSAYNSNNPLSNTVRGAVGVAGKAAVGTAKFAGKAAVGATFGLAAGIAGDDLEDVAKYGLAGAALGVTGLPALGRGVSNAASNLRNTYETEAFGVEQATLMQQSREQMKNEEYREGMDELYQEMYGKEPTAAQSKAFAKQGLDYYNAGFTETKDIKKSMKFEKELKDKMLAEGTPEDVASDNARKQALVISNLSKEVDKKELINEAKRNDRKNQFYKQLKDAGMDEKAATAGADYTIQLLMKRHGLSPE